MKKLTPMPDTESRKLIGRTVKELSKISDVKAIYLFGSYATGKQTRFSDIDICVITDKKISADKKAEIVSNSSEKVEIVLFWELPVIIRYRLLKEGVNLLEQDRRFLQDAMLSTLREYLDFQPVIKKFANAVGVSYG